MVKRLKNSLLYRKTVYPREFIKNLRDQTFGSLYWECVSFRFVIQGFNYTSKSGKDKGRLFV